jgi:hypothetical protein
MRFPKISDVARDLREIAREVNGYSLDSEEGVDVRLQVEENGDWRLWSGDSQYDTDHRGHWGASSIPSDGSSFNVSEVAKDLVSQAKDSYGMSRPTAGPRKARMSRFEGRQKKLFPESIVRKPAPPKHPRPARKAPRGPQGWHQIGGDMTPEKHGGLIAKRDGTSIELIEIQPVREYVGESEAKDVGFPFWSKTAYYDARELDPERGEVRTALRSMDIKFDDIAGPNQDMAIAEALMRYGYQVEEGPGGWAKDVLGKRKVIWWASGKKAIGWKYLADEDREFKRLMKE